MVRRQGIVLILVSATMEHSPSILHMSSAAGAFLELTLILIPLSVAVAWIMGIEMDLDFSLLKTGCLAFTIIVTAFTLQIKILRSISELNHPLIPWTLEWLFH
ncbi:hypothetical protein RIF29_01905 [Crotalaria pallida]|uniref:Uncharacterized protein n=1 Tax=Crotalaria pallida TaxID=3830 RepID=A0AAN9IYT3_CROPI